MGTKYFHFKAFEYEGFFLLVNLSKLRGENSEDKPPNTLILLRLIKA